MDKLILIVMMGLPRSGKSTWAFDFSRKHGVPVVNPDSIRLALHGQRFQTEAEPFVWAIAKVMVRSLFIAGHKEVIVDATNTSKSRRDFWQPTDVDPWEETVFKHINTSKEVCMERSDEVLKPVIERMNENFEPLQEGEHGF